MGDLAQLAGRRALEDAHALEPVEALAIPPDRLRALLIADAELGERIMRALILRRVGLLQAGAGGPVIIGRADSGDAEAMVAPADALAAIPDELGAAEAAPLLCAGVTTFNALRHSGAMPGDVVAFLGIGGLGHLGVQFANSASAPSRSHAAPTRRCSPASLILTVPLHDRPPAPTRRTPRRIAKRRVYSRAPSQLPPSTRPFAGDYANVPVPHGRYLVIVEDRSVGYDKDRDR